ncbi:hypothetical protein PVAP13_7NG307400 [Panicum virgatum]|uniref:Uncharacterized protein n=1 Tax=Panicum virgatum TaxID=38727 RepID=A0A8T0Q2E8_PANVG|nr:hypothetical protein PVAP13_7NG307400 [Panicum virgatum]
MRASRHRLRSRKPPPLGRPNPSPLASSTGEGSRRSRDAAGRRATASGWLLGLSRRDLPRGRARPNPGRRRRLSERRAAAGCLRPAAPPVLRMAILVARMAL